jgi:hypothetical protein
VTVALFLMAASVGCYLLKLAGLSVPSGVIDAPRVQRVAVLLPVALLAALTVTGTFASGRHLVVDARAAGLAAAIVAIRFRAPFLLVVGLGLAQRHGCDDVAMCRRGDRSGRMHLGQDVLAGRIDVVRTAGVLLDRGDQMVEGLLVLDAK